MIENPERGGVLHPMNQTNSDSSQPFMEAQTKLEKNDNTKRAHPTRSYPPRLNKFTGLHTKFTSS